MSKALSAIIATAAALLLATLVLLQAARSQGASPETIAAYREFHSGKAEAAIAHLKTIIAGQTALRARVPLERDLLEICATAYEWRCVDETLTTLAPELQQDPALNGFAIEAKVYLVKELMWFRQYAPLDEFLQRAGGPTRIAPAGSPFLTLSELQIALHAKHIDQQDFAAGEDALSSAFLEVLLSDPQKNAYYVAKTLVGMIEALIEAQDIVGAIALADAVDGYVSRTLEHDGIVFARYRLARAQLVAFGGDPALGAKMLLEAYGLIDGLDINPDVKVYRLATTASLASAALILAGNLAEAQAVHGGHPLQGSRERILSNGEFHDFAEFIFAVSDIFVGAATGAAMDSRWRPLLEKRASWNAGKLETANIESYRQFALGLLDLAAADAEQGQRELIAAAKQRLDNFEAVSRLNSEGFQLPSLVDQIMLRFGVEAAMGSRSADSADLLLRAAEILNRTTRHALGDASAVINSQPDERAREVVRSYSQLLSHKREWSIDKLKRLLASRSPVADKGALIQEFEQIVRQLADMKKAFRGSDSAIGLPTAQMVRQALSDHAVFLTAFPALSGMGRLCISAGEVAYSVVPVDAAKVRADVRLIEFATTSGNPPDPVLDSQFPVASALALHHLLFSGLEPCLAPGVNATVVLHSDLAGVPLGALLDREPPSTPEGYDLRGASWLVKRMSFASAVSARQFVAERAGRKAPEAPREYLGIGDPLVNKPQVAALEQESAFRGAFRSGSGEAVTFAQLPETRDELLQVGNLLGAQRADILLGADATEERFRSKPLADYAVIHFATHGLIAADVPGLTESALLLTAGEGDPYDDGLLSASEIAQLSLNARLVVLSACNSAKYNLRQASLGVNDLHAAFTFAGAPTLVASLWPVESQSARDLITAFFEEWRGGNSGAAQAMATATRTFLAHADAAHQHPRFWASFVVVGNGAVVDEPASARPPPAAAFAPVGTQGGTLYSVARSGESVFLSMASDWDGKKMASIISARGATSWSVSSREVGAAKVRADGDHVYALGYTSEANPTPALRLFSPDGRLQWDKRYAELRGYSFADAVIVPDGILVVAVPFYSAPGSRSAYLLKIGADGELTKRVEFTADTSGTVIGTRAVMQPFGDRIVVVVNRGATSALNQRETDLIGLHPICHSNAAAVVFEFDRNDLTLTSTRSLAAIRADSLQAWNGGLYLGGEAFADCARFGNAALYKLGAPDQLVWRDSDLVRGAVSGLAAAAEGLWVAVSYERPFTVPSLSGPISAAYHKRDSESGSAFREAAIYKLAAVGSFMRTQTLAAGLSTYVLGLAASREDEPPIMFGEMGGMPAASRLPE